MSLLQRADTEMALPSSLVLVEEISHRVLNEYTEVIGTLSLAAAGASNSWSTQAIRNAMDRLRLYAEAHRALQAPLTAGDWDLSVYLSQLCKRFSEARLAERGVRLIVSTDEVWMEASRCWRVGLIVAELIRNAGRHGLRGGPGEIRLELGRSRDYVNCTVSDNGFTVVSRNAGRGRRLVETLAAELGGVAKWDFEPAGCSVTLTIPANPMVSVTAPG